MQACKALTVWLLLSTAGNAYHIPVMVKTSGSGPTLFLQSSIHGDELAGAKIIQELFQELDPATMTGTVVGIVGANPTGMLMHSRNFYSTSDGGACKFAKPLLDNLAWCLLLNRSATKCANREQPQSLDAWQQLVFGCRIPTRLQPVEQSVHAFQARRIP